MNFTHLWKVVVSLSLADKVLALTLIVGAILGVLIAIWNVTPLAVGYAADLWRRHGRRRARRRSRALRHDEWAPGVRESVARRAAGHNGSVWSGKVWLAVAGCSAISVIGGVMLGLLLHREPETKNFKAQLTDARPDAARLRIDYELRER